MTKLFSVSPLSLDQAATDTGPAAREPSDKGQPEATGSSTPAAAHLMVRGAAAEGPKLSVRRSGGSEETQKLAEGAGNEGQQGGDKPLVGDSVMSSLVGDGDRGIMGALRALGARIGGKAKAEAEAASFAHLTAGARDPLAAARARLLHKVFSIVLTRRPPRLTTWPCICSK